MRQTAVARRIRFVRTEVQVAVSVARAPTFSDWSRFRDRAFSDANARLPYFGLSFLFSPNMRPWTL